MVVVDNAGIIRDGRYIVLRRAEPGARQPGPFREVSVNLTRPVREALAMAASPAPLSALADRLAARFPTTSIDRIWKLLDGLVDQRILITSLRAPMTAVDGLHHLIEALRAADAAGIRDVAATLRQLEDVHACLARHNHSGTAAQAAAIRRATADKMAALVPGSEHTLAVDVGLDADIAVPQAVLRESGLAASVLLRLSTKPFGAAAWMDYHARFRVRYGPGALIPVRELVADSGLGYPSGYLGAPRARPAWRMLTERDAILLALIQKSTLDGSEEISLSDTDIDALTVGDHDDAVLPDRVEIGVAVQAESAAAIGRGEFRLWLTATPRAHTSMAGRFAYLLGDEARVRLADSYTAPGPAAEAQPVMTAQISYPPRRPHNENVVRVLRQVEQVVHLSEHPDRDSLSVQDLAVTADADQMYLVHRSTGRRVVPRIAHALDMSVQTPPLARFLAEVADARRAVFGPFDLGAARTLPYVPRIRYRRIVLAPARWLVAATDLPVHESAGWAAALAAWRQRWRVPARVVLCRGELRLPLDLGYDLDRTLLRTQLRKASHLELYEDTPPGADGWVGRPAELLFPLRTITPAARPLPVTAAPARTMRPGRSRVVHAQLVGNPARFDDILLEHLPAFLDVLADLGVRRWWVRRHRDLIRLDADQHLAIFLRLDSADHYGPVAARLADLATDLHARGLPGQLNLAPYEPHPARYGHGAAMDAAEHVFATDTQAAIAELAAARAADVPAQALAAASMARLAAAFALDPQSGYRALLHCLGRRAGPVDRTLTQHARRLSTPDGNFAALHELPGGEHVAAAWQARDQALHTYHRALVKQRDPATVLRTLLHEHHIRALGADPQFEAATNHIARTAALRCLTQDLPA